jgi:hypothetical protein
MGLEGLTPRETARREAPTQVNALLCNNWIEIPVQTDPFGDGLVVSTSAWPRR